MLIMWNQITHLENSNMSFDIKTHLKRRTKVVRRQMNDRKTYHTLSIYDSHQHATVIMGQERYTFFCWSWIIPVISTRRPLDSPFSSSYGFFLFEPWFLWLWDGRLLCCIQHWEIHLKFRRSMHPDLCQIELKTDQKHWVQILPYDVQLFACWQQEVSLSKAPRSLLLKGTLAVLFELHT